MHANFRANDLSRILLLPLIPFILKVTNLFYGEISRLEIFEHFTDKYWLHAIFS